MPPRGLRIFKCPAHRRCRYAPVNSSARLWQLGNRTTINDNGRDSLEKLLDIYIDILIGFWHQ